MSELSGHKRKASPMEVEPHRGHNGRAPHATSTHATAAPADRLQQALNYARGYFKGTHMPIDGWFQPCQ
jgi:hypothetical protein